MSANPLFRTGERAPVSGQYDLVGALRKRQGTEVKGHRFPPPGPSEPGFVGYRLTDPTLHRRRMTLAWLLKHRPNS